MGQSRARITPTQRSRSLRVVVLPRVSSSRTKARGRPRVGLPPLFDAGPPRLPLKSSSCGSHLHLRRVAAQEGPAMVAIHREKVVISRYDGKILTDGRLIEQDRA